MDATTKATYDFCKVGLTIRTCQAVLISEPLILAFMAEDHVPVCRLLLLLLLLTRPIHGGGDVAHDKGMLRDGLGDDVQKVSRKC